MKKLFMLLCVLMIASTLVFAAGSAEAPKAEDGGLSGKLMIYTSMYDDVIEAIDETLE